MNKLLLLALLFIPFIAGCTANANSPNGSNVTLERFDFTSEDLVKSEDMDVYDSIEFEVPSGALIVNGKVCETPDFLGKVSCTDFHCISSEWCDSDCGRARIKDDPDTGTSVLYWSDRDMCDMQTVAVIIAY